MESSLASYFFLRYAIIILCSKRGKIMSEAYVECLVKARTSGVKNAVKYLLFLVTGLVFVLALLSGYILLLVLAVAIGVLAYFVNLNADVEYEYLYLDKELTVDKVLAKTKRKRVAVYQLSRMEVLAPIKSYHLDDYKNRDVKVRDFSVGYEDKPDLRYAMYYEGGEKILLSPSPELIKVMRNVAPRKVFDN